MSDGKMPLCKLSSDDLVIENGKIARVSGADQVVQQVLSQFKIWKGEWFLDRELGYTELADFSKRAYQVDLDIRAAELLLNTEGVKRVNYVDVRYERSSRTMYVVFSAATIYGDVTASNQL